jgi:hypothetical protein
MYAHSDEYRLDVFARPRVGARRRIAPTDLTVGARPSIEPLLAGADHWRVAPRVEDLRAALPALARHACEVVAAAEIEMVLEDRAREGAVPRTTRAFATCAP